MKKHHLLNYMITCLSLASCDNIEPLKIKQISSKEIVTFFVNTENGLDKKDSISIIIPTEFELKLNTSKVRVLDLNYILNKRRLMDDFFEYQVYNKKNRQKPIYSLKPYLNDNPLNIIIKERNHLISKDDANGLLKKYNIKKSVNNLKIGDTIKLIPFDQLLKENKKILDELNKINDSIFFRVTLKGGEVLIVKQKINW
ncbi:hypothetical protein [Flavobacterium ustbae]|uniref:hypothetical protein n=1 Tax=Flavobacterium ustbae TaxID=2488790 RepID=UPI000F78D122|nr:hypothetical protein [Flavobacterium ustbae]